MLNDSKLFSDNENFNHSSSTAVAVQWAAFVRPVHSVLADSAPAAHGFLALL